MLEGPAAELAPAGPAAHLGRQLHRQHGAQQESHQTGDVREHGQDPVHGPRHVTEAAQLGVEQGVGAAGGPVGRPVRRRAGENVAGAQSSGTSTAWPLAALRLTASVNSM